MTSVISVMAMTTTKRTKMQRMLRPRLPGASPIRMLRLPELGRRLSQNKTGRGRKSDNREECTDADFRRTILSNQGGYMRRIYFLLLLALLCAPAAFPQGALKESLLVLSKRDHTLAIVDPATLKVVTKMPVGDDPHE